MDPQHCFWANIEKKQKKSPKKTQKTGFFQPCVQALKGAPQGIVRIGVAKPLPVPDTSQLTSTTSDEGPEEENSDAVGGAALEDEEADENTNTEDNTEVRSAVSDMETDQEAAAPRQQGGSLLSPEKRGGRRGDSISSDLADLPPPLPTSPLPEEEEAPAATSRRGSAVSPASAMPMPATERLIGGTKKAAAPQPPSFMKAAEERSTAVAMTTDADNIPALPTALEQRVRIAKDADTLGLQAGLWIRTDLMRHPDTDPDPVPDPGFL
jgi:hypothetical protein